ncbi:MAG: vitamin B12 dependent-methionine synthase activation domain-containing protein [Candidatus Hodarchaeales archaeon]|jgi:5-methyltetrahydrofolate--homocysteine methyltransferase
MKSSNVSILSALPEPMDFERCINSDYLLPTIWKWVDSKLLYNKLLGFKGNFDKSLENKDPKAIQLSKDVEGVKLIVRTAKTNLMAPKTIFQFFYCEKQNDTLILFNNNHSKKSSSTNPIGKLALLRQEKRKNLCLSDYIHPDGDTIALFVATCGEEVEKYAFGLKKEGKYKSSVILQALALASVEALAEMLHQQIRKKWRIEDNQGKRYSFGYPACPNLEDQEIIWNLLHPQEIGVELTEGFMMDPEASISAIVFHHPEAEYFKV